MDEGVVMKRAWLVVMVLCTGSVSGGAQTSVLRSASEEFEVTKLLPTPGRDFERFGASVALEGSTRVVGAPGQWRFLGVPGQVYVFEQTRRNGWQLSACIEPPEGPTEETSFGRSVGISGDVLAVGWPFASGAGGVVLYTRDGSGGWTLVEHIVGPGSHLGSDFVLLNGEVIGGAPNVSGISAIVGAFSRWPTGTV